MFLHPTLPPYKNIVSYPAFLYGNPTYAGDLAAGILDLVESKCYGCYHIVGPGYINRYDWAVKFLKMAGMDPGTIEKIQHPPAGMVPRPLRSNLDTKKFRDASHIKMHDIDEGLEIFINEMK